jgi:hypothetical protein
VAFLVVVFSVLFLLISLLQAFGFASIQGTEKCSTSTSCMGIQANRFLGRRAIGRDP